MFWVAEYSNGEALPQFDPFTGLENSFAQVDHRQVIRFWWLPITPRMMSQFPNTRCNPLLKNACVETKGSKGFVARRIQITFGGPIPVRTVKCYVLGIEGGPRRELYPDGTIIDREWPTSGETQELLHG
jgi:hypothetical protein